MPRMPPPMQTYIAAVRRAAGFVANQCNAGSPLSRGVSFALTGRSVCIAAPLPAQPQPSPSPAACSKAASCGRLEPALRPPRLARSHMAIGCRTHAHARVHACMVLCARLVPQVRRPFLGLVRSELVQRQALARCAAALWKLAAAAPLLTMHAHHARPCLVASTP